MVTLSIDDSTLIMDHFDFLLHESNILFLDWVRNAREGKLFHIFFALSSSALIE